MKNKVFLIVMLFMMLCVFMFSFSACSYKVDPNAVNLVSISEGVKHQTIEGFGASSCWWSQIVGGNSNADEIVKLLYSGEDGLGMSIYRYNIGAGSKDIWEYNEKDRMTESFLNVTDDFDYANATSDELLAYVTDVNNYDFNKDANAQSILEKSLAYGQIEELVLFANSPHYILTKNNQAHCLADQTNNLDSENFEAYAAYLMMVLKYFAVDKNYDVDYLSPINEPQWNWNNNYENKQEGCYYDPENCASCLDVIYKALQEFNATYNKDVKLDAFESGNWNTKTTGTKSYITKYLDEMQKYEYFTQLKHVSFHSYSSAGSALVRENFMKKVEDYNIQVAITEYCQMSSGIDDSFASAQYLGVVMAYDMSILNASEWTWWIAVSNQNTYTYNDGLLYTDWWKNEEEIIVAPRYYAMQHYSKFIKPGDQYVDVKMSNKNTLLTESELSPLKYFYENEDEKTNYSDEVYNVFVRDDGTVIVVYNNITNYDYTWNFADQYKNFEAYTSMSESYMNKSEGKFKGSYTFAANSITTLILK